MRREFLIITAVNGYCSATAHEPPFCLGARCRKSSEKAPEHCAAAHFSATENFEPEFWRFDKLGSTSGSVLFYCGAWAYNRGIVRTLALCTCCIQAQSTAWA